MAVEGYERVHVETREEWRRWLAENHASSPGAWLVSWKRATGRPAVGYDAAVEEALCFGWIDSTVNILDDERGLQLMTRRKPKSGWTRLNRQRVAALEAQGRTAGGVRPGRRLRGRRGPRRPGRRCP